MSLCALEVFSHDLLQNGLLILGQFNPLGANCDLFPSVELFMSPLGIPKGALPCNCNRVEAATCCGVFSFAVAGMSIQVRTSACLCAVVRLLFGSPFPWLSAIVAFT